MSFDILNLSKAMAGISLNVLGICEVSTIVGIWTSISEPHIHLFGDPKDEPVTAGKEFRTPRYL